MNDYLSLLFFLLFILWILPTTYDATSTFKVQDFRRGMKTVKSSHRRERVKVPHEKYRGMSNDKNRLQFVSWEGKGGMGKRLSQKRDVWLGVDSLI